jgi:type I restriction enzyme M protein
MAPMSRSRTITKLYGAFADGAMYPFTIDGQPQERVVCKVFPNAHFGFHKITVERPLHLNFQASPERIARLDEREGLCQPRHQQEDEERGRERLNEIAVGHKRQQAIKDLLAQLPADKLYMDRKGLPHRTEESLPSAAGPKLLDAGRDRKRSSPHSSERDPNANVCTGMRRARPEADSELRDTESVPLNETIEAYFKREVLPHVPDAWIDSNKTKVGYEVPLTREFYVYTPPRELEEIEGEIAGLEQEIMAMLKDVTV